jgi:hypothetical protein
MVSVIEKILTLGTKSWNSQTSVSNKSKVQTWHSTGCRPDVDFVFIVLTACAQASGSVLIVWKNGSMFCGIGIGGHARG